MMATHAAVKATPEQSIPLERFGDFTTRFSIRQSQHTLAHDFERTGAGGGARMARRRSYGSRRRRSPAAGGVAVLAIALAAWAGALLSAVAVGAEARFISNRLAAQSSASALYGPPQVPGHPGNASTLQRNDMVRMFMSLDGVN